MRLEIGGLIRDQGIGRAVGLVEPVPGEFCHQIKDVFGLVQRNFVFLRALHELAFFRLHDLRDLLAHGASQHIGVTQ